MGSGYPWRLLDLAFAVLEAAAVLLSVQVHFRAALPLASLLAVAAPVLLAAAALELTRAGRAPRDAGADADLDWPGRSLRRRTVLGVLCSAACGGLAMLRLGAPKEVLVLFLWSGALVVPLIDALRAWLLTRRSGRLRPPQQAGLAGFRKGYRSALVIAALCTAAPALLIVLAYAYFLVNLTPLQYLRLHLHLPPVAIVLLGLWGLWLRGRLRVIEAYLRRPEGADAAPVYRRAQLLPYLLGLSKVLLWSAGGGVLFLLGRWRLGIDVESGVLLLGEIVLCSLGAALYEVLWHRATLAPLLAHLAMRQPAGAGPRTPLSLRKKMLVAFGTVTLFACGLSLSWSVMQYRTVATRYIRQLNRLRLSALQAEVREGRPATPAELEVLLRRHARNQVLVYHLPPGLPPGALRGYAAPSGPAAPALREREWTAVVAAPAVSGDLDLPAEHLSASFLRLGTDGGAPGGLVLIAQPGYHGGDLDTKTRILIGFFLLLLFGSMGVVVLTASDLTRPLLELERRAAAITRGDLGRPAEPVAVEADEVGRLYYAFKAMRRALSERFRSSTQVHFALEAQVARRTAELERRNKELKDAAQALRQAQKELLQAEKMASMGRLVAGIAHEINNPVNAVVNTAGPLGEALGELQELLRQQPDDQALGRALADASADMRTMLRVVQRGAHRTKEIVRALHNYSRGDGGAPEPVDLERCLEDSLDLLQHHLKKDIALERDYGPAGVVPGYGGQLQQVFMNLLTNAAQALLAGPRAATAPATIRLVTRRQGAQALVTIADNGPGIPKEVLPRIFDPFFTTKDVGQGSGLGLSIVHSIVERHGGSIAVDSEVGRGTRITVCLNTEKGPE